tara:strand:+ start:1067 stop:1843 length:777 start_codon:yes stop_codon:yes gene_type:complete
MKLFRYIRVFGLSVALVGLVVLIFWNTIGGILTILLGLFFVFRNYDSPHLLKPDPNSYIKTWTYRKMEESKKESEATVLMLFISLMYGLCMALHSNDEDSENEILGISDYKSDSALFELGCYLMFRVDVFLFTKHKLVREHLSPPLTNSFVKLFEEAFSDENIGDLFDSRQLLYSELIKERDWMKTSHFHLEQLISRTKGGQHPSEYHPDQGLEIISALSAMGLKSHIMSWETSILPTLLDNISKYVNEVQSPQNSNK